jgi:hypothetical protein
MSKEGQNFFIGNFIFLIGNLPLPYWKIEPRCLSWCEFS